MPQFINTGIMELLFQLSVESNSRLLWFCFTLPCDWLTDKTRGTFSANEKQNQNQSRVARAHFGVGCTPLTSNFYWFTELSTSLVQWSVGVIVLVLVLRHNWPYSYSGSWTGSSMKWRLLRGNTFTYEKIPPQEPPLHARSSSTENTNRIENHSNALFNWVP